MSTLAVILLSLFMAATLIWGFAIKPILVARDFLENEFAKERD